MFGTSRLIRRVVWGKGGGRSGGETGRSAGSNPIGHNYLVGAGVDDRVSADGCGRETDLSETCRAILYRSPRAAAGQETTNPSSSPFPRPLLLYGMGRIRIPTRTRFHLAGNKPLDSDTAAHSSQRALREENSRQTQKGHLFLTGKIAASPLPLVEECRVLIGPLTQDRWITEEGDYHDTGDRARLARHLNRTRRTPTTKDQKRER